VLHPSDLRNALLKKWQELGISLTQLAENLKMSPLTLRNFLIKKREISYKVRFRVHKFLLEGKE